MPTLSCRLDGNKHCQDYVQWELLDETKIYKLGCMSEFKNLEIHSDFAGGFLNGFLFKCLKYTSLHKYSNVLFFNIESVSKYPHV